MGRLQKAVHLLKNDRSRIRRMLAANWRTTKLSRLVPDKLFLKMQYKAYIGKKLNLKQPKTFNEKLQWLKLYNRKPEYVALVDKYCVREYIAQKLGEKYLIPLLGVWDRAEDIDFDALPDQFVLKCNHDSASVTICRDKTHFDTETVRKKLNRCLKQNMFWLGREWPYKDVAPKIICEKYMVDSDDAQGALTDYKFFCFNGYVDCVMICLDRHLGDTKFYFFDQAWNLKRLNVRGKNAPEGFTLPKPVCMDEMFQIAQKLSEGLPFSRIDLYECNAEVYFGEITFFPDSGFDPNLLEETDRYFGELINLDM